MRLDQKLVAMGLAGSRAQATALIKAGVVAVDGAAARKSGRLVDPDAMVSLLSPPPPEVGAWVSRAGVKLAHALETFQLSPHEAVVLDVGASTGGFTEVCLKAGAARVYALDVGRDQLHPRVQSDPRVVELSGVNAKSVNGALIPEPLDWIVSDVSFISLTKALPAPLSLARPGAQLAALVKPQFEVGPAGVGKGGIVKDAELQTGALEAVAAFLDASGWRVEGRAESPILGGDGNREFLISAVKI
ncbi:MAG: TlyA family RNA methyltransferase [Rhodobacteraceae bacterium]|nr:TlyA family RNA methyltransferase [Paracoccaceae bacterium]